jgi:peptide/nickel transport system substrate-binding protein
VSAKANKWQGRNITRWQNKEYDEIYKASQSELDPIKRAALMIKMNDMVVNDHIVIPVVARPVVTAVSNKLTAELSGWDTNTWDIASWFREG